MGTHETKTTKTAKTPRPTAEGATSSRVAQALVAMRARQPTIDDALREAFRRQRTDAYCTLLGGRTRGALVFRDAMAWARRIDGALKKPDRSGVPITGEHFAWYLECLEALRLGLVAKAGAADGSGDAAQALDAARRLGDAVAVRLARRLREVAGGDPAWTHELAEAQANTGVEDATVTRLRGLAGLVERWLDRGDAGIRALLAVHGVAAEDARRARAAARALDDALDAKPAANAVARDTPAVNLAEGRVLVCMRQFRKMLAEAREEGRTTLVLVPGPATRGVVVPRREEEAEAQAGGGPDGDGGEGGGEAAAPEKPAVKRGAKKASTRKARRKRAS